MKNLNLLMFLSKLKITGIAETKKKGNLTWAEPRRSGYNTERFHQSLNYKKPDDIYYQPASSF